MTRSTWEKVYRSNGGAKHDKLESGVKKKKRYIPIPTLLPSLQRAVSNSISTLFLNIEHKINTKAKQGDKQHSKQ